jgi:hypothetical protein
LRAKARKERWEEEMELVKNEMDWVVNCFEHKERVWKEMAEGAREGGPMAYAWKQSWMWGQCAKTAANTFKLLKGV